ncbi:hypothetical protein ACIA8O_39985 [Kitasatospora sp. NPDC051853]|uniref:hypothetical protein n=1 Tax=Kitasatospora sp. NPDC051853 TaxID=3364058 RepID=UPI0037B0B79C
MSEAERSGRYRSKLVYELRHLRPSLRAALRLEDHFLTLLDGAVGICAVLSDQTDERPRLERLEDFFDEFSEEIGEGDLSLLLAFFETLDTATWVARAERIAGAGFRRYVRRLLGAASYNRIETAFKEDAAVVVFALRLGVRAAMPYAVAWSDAVQVVSKEQLKAVNGSAIAGADLVDAVMKFDTFVGTKMFSTLPMEMTTASGEDLKNWGNAELPGLLEQFRAVVAESSIRRIEEANAPLVRKIKGARSALENSEDGASQAANSLIELFDRITREAFPKSTVLEWSDANFPDDTDMFHCKDNLRAPTKRAETLCFIHAGKPIDRDNPQGYLIQEVIARALVATRNKLEKIKHSDKGTPQERDQVLHLSKALGAALLLALSFAKMQSKTEPAEVPQ